jgi:predicted amidohydrolase
MGTVRVALLQMAGCGADLDASRAKGERFCRLAGEQGADVALFPEMWSVGMTFFDARRAGDRQRWEARAVTRDGPFVTHFRDLARELEMAIALTYLEKWEGKLLFPPHWHPPFSRNQIARQNLPPRSRFACTDQPSIHSL